MLLTDALREVRDQVFGAATVWKRTTQVEGVTLSLDDASPRMRYVMCRGYESEDARLAARILTPRDSVIEAGTAIGFLAIYCRKVLGVADYAMVEANPALLDVIRRNFALNGLPPPEPLCAAVTPKDGDVSFGVNRNFWSSSLVERPGEERITVRGLSLPTLLAGLPFRPTTLIMDIEGGEASIPVAHFDPFRKIIMETHRKLVGDTAIDQLLAGLHTLGFREAAQEGGSFAFVRE